MALGAAAAMLALQLALYPPAISIVDEAAYLTFTYVIRAGHLHPSAAQQSIWHGEFLDGGTISVVPPGQSLLMLPATLFDWHLIFMVSIALLLAGFFIFRELLAQLRISKSWGYLYLLYPPLVFYSRTAMSEVASAAAVLTGLLLYRRGGRSLYLCGLVLGLSPWIRYTNLIALAGLLIVAAWRDVMGLRANRPRSLASAWRSSTSARMLVGCAVPLALFVAYNLALYHHLTPPNYGGANYFGLRYVPGHLLVFLWVILTVFPLMGVGLFLYRGSMRAEFTVIAVAVLLIMSAYAEIEDAGSLLRTLVVQSRYLVPFAVVFLVPYAALLDRINTRRLPRLVWLAPAALVLIGFFADGALSLVSERHLRDTADTRDVIVRELAGGCALIAKDAPVFVNPAWTPASWKYFAPDDPTVPQMRCPTGAQPGWIVFVGHPDSDEPYLAAVDSLARSMNARVTVDRRTQWLVRVWRLP